MCICICIYNIIYNNICLHTRRYKYMYLMASFVRGLMIRGSLSTCGYHSSYMYIHRWLLGSWQDAHSAAWVHKGVGNQPCIVRSVSRKLLASMEIYLQKYFLLSIGDGHPAKSSLIRFCLAESC
jgi:hypothetical protein